MEVSLPKDLSNNSMKSFQMGKKLKKKKLGRGEGGSKWIKKLLHRNTLIAMPNVIKRQSKTNELVSAQTEAMSEKGTFLISSARSTIVSIPSQSSRTRVLRYTYRKGFQKIWCCVRQPSQWHTYTKGVVPYCLMYTVGLYLRCDRSRHQTPVILSLNFQWGQAGLREVAIYLPGQIFFLPELSR